MPPSSSRTHFRQRPYCKRRPRAVGSDLKGCVLWLLPVHPSDLVHSSCEGASKTSRGHCEKWEREEDPTILLVQGRDDLLRTSVSLPFCQTLTCPYGETALPSGSAIPPLGRVREGRRVRARRIWRFVKA